MQSRLVVSLFDIELFLELLHTSASVDKLLLASIERMAC